jgi:hypothetical protein
MSTDRLGMTVLDTKTCLELLRAESVGRLAVAIHDHPDIFPVNFVVDRGTVVFRTAEGTKLAAAVLGRGVAFEIDGLDDAERQAWSVVIKGSRRRGRALAGALRRPGVAPLPVARLAEAPLRAHRAGGDQRTSLRRRGTVGVDRARDERAMSGPEGRPAELFALDQGRAAPCSAHSTSGAW